MPINGNIDASIVVKHLQESYIEINTGKNELKCQTGIVGQHFDG